MHYSVRILAGVTISGFTLMGCDSTRPLVATRLAFENQPSAAIVSGQPLDAVQVAVLTGDGRPVSGTDYEVAITLSSSDTAAHLTGTTTVHTTTGVATFPNLTVARAGSGFHLVAQVAGLESTTSEAFAITPGPATQLRFDPFEETGLVGAAIPAVVRVTDASGNTVPGATNQVTLAFTRNGSFGMTVAPDGLFGQTTVAAASGVATFSGVTFQKSGSYTLSAKAAGLSDAMSNTLLMMGGTITRLIFFTEPPNGTASTALASFSVLQVDDYGNGMSLPPGASYSATLAFGNNPGGAALGGTLDKLGYGATALTYGDVSIDKPGTGYTLIATSNGRTVTSTPFDIQ